MTRPSCLLPHQPQTQEPPLSAPPRHEDPPPALTPPRRGDGLRLRPPAPPWPRPLGPCRYRCSPPRPSTVKTGGALDIKGGYGSTKSSGKVTIATADAGTTGVSGLLSLSSGTSSGLGGSGAVLIGSGAATGGTAGAVTITVGSGTSGAGGVATMYAGRSTVNTGGVLSLASGEGTATSSGSVQVRSANAGTAGAHRHACVQHGHVEARATLARCSSALAQAYGRTRRPGEP